MDPKPNLLCIACYIPCIFRCNILQKATTRSLDISDRCCAVELIREDVFLKPELLMEPLITQQPSTSPIWDNYGIPTWDYDSNLGYAGALAPQWPTKW